MNRILIIGAGGHAKVVAETVLAEEKYDDLIFLDDDSKKSVHGRRVFGPLKKYLDKNLKDSCRNAFVAFGNNSKRMEWIYRLIDEGYEVPNIIHPKSYVSSSAKVGLGTIILAGSVIQSEVKIGKGVIINTGSLIDHDTNINDGVHICPGVTIAGNVSIDSGTWVGIGSTIIQNINIGKDAILGAGTVVIKDIPNQIKVVGIPAKPI